MTPRCPRCDGRDLVPCSETLEASGERIEATHECKRCQTRFRFTPAAQPFNPIRVRGSLEEA